MIACDNSECKFEWFHFPCVGLTKKPEPNHNGEWYCMDCLEKENEKEDEKKAQN
jgi:hypothetical protein